MQATCCCIFTSCRTHVNTFMHAHITAAVTQANYMHNCTLHTGTLLPTSCHLQTAHVHVYSAFRMCLCACCLCSQCAWWHHSCMEHVFVQGLACGMLVSGMQMCIVFACMWVACIHAVCGIHVSVVGFHVAYRHVWEMYNASALFVAKPSYHIQ